MLKIEEQIENIKKILKEAKIQNIYLNFVDFSGKILTKMVGVDELINNTHVSWFDGISLNGKLLEEFKSEKDSDWLVLLPDPFSFRRLTFLEDENQRAGMIFCNIKNNSLDTRGILKNAVNEFIRLGITPMIGTQLIYAILNTQCNQDFYQTFATNENTIFNNDVVNYLLQANIEIEYYMPYGKKHQRIDLVPDIANIAADKLFTAKWFVQNLGIKENKEISFENMEQDYISSCPVHMSLWKGKHDKNLFFDENGKYELSKTGRNFVQGILKHQKFIQKVLEVNTSNQIKKYKNCCSVNRDNSIINIPLYFKEKQKQDRVGWSKRCIYNGLNSDVNYYLMFSCLLYAGLYGIENKEDIKDKKISFEESMEYFKDKLGEGVINKIITKLGENNEK